MAQVLGKAEFGDWISRFLPELAAGKPLSLFAPVAVSDRSDGKIAHLDGLNLSRAWAWRELAGHLSPALGALPPSGIWSAACPTLQATTWASIGWPPTPSWR